MARVRLKLSSKGIDDRYPWMNDEMHQLFVDMAEIEDFREVVEFMRDLLTDDELRMLAQRWHIARAIWVGRGSYEEMAKEIETSTTTITRIAYRVWYGCGGFKGLLEKVLPKKMSEDELEAKEEKEFKEREARSRGMVRGPRFAKKYF